MTHRTRDMALPALLISGSLVLASVQVGYASDESSADTQPAQAAPTSSAEPAQAPWSADELNQLVAPIALYPDALVAQIVAAASYPTEVVEADRWMQQHADLQGAELAKATDPQSWDPSIKALTQFPSVLATMDKNLSWTSALGDAYASQPQNLLDAVQVMRGRAQQAGNLASTPQESVTTEGQSIVIQPSDPDVVYVPEYDPWDVYGEPVEFYPGWVGGPDAYVGAGIGFGVGVGIGFMGGFGWGWHHWGADWHGRDVQYNHNAYISHSSTFINRNHGYGDHTGFNPGFAGNGHPGFNHPGGFGGGAPAGAGRAPLGDHSNAFSGFNHGGVTSGFSSRGQASVGGGAHGGGGFHGGGGGGASHGGGHR
ncbi:MAG: hypothetical protein JWN43_1775 [Gammaproteobacteria bacterium]|nr:hypothetical protein [Gammaproteobacteria bacterium]